MKKMWVKKENIYHKPFYKQKLKMTMLFVLLMGIVFFTYQIFYMNQLQLSNSRQANSFTSVQVTTTTRQYQLQQRQSIPGSETIIRGIRVRDQSMYRPTVDGKFKCFKTDMVIPFDWVNDNYCDCVDGDGSDEPGTNACPNGVFYCNHQRRSALPGFSRQDSIPNSRVNDGICDCCDGTDEWLMVDGATCPMKCL